MNECRIYSWIQDTHNSTTLVLLLLCDVRCHKFLLPFALHFTTAPRFLRDLSPGPSRLSHDYSPFSSFISCPVLLFRTYLIPFVMVVDSQ